LNGKYRKRILYEELNTNSVIATTNEQTTSTASQIEIKIETSIKH